MVREKTPSNEGDIPQRLKGGQAGGETAGYSEHNRQSCGSNLSTKRYGVFLLYVWSPPSKLQLQTTTFGQSSRSRNIGADSSKTAHHFVLVPSF